MSNQTNAWVRRFDFLALAGWLMISIGLAVVSFIWFGVDFRGYYAAARVLIAGGNPYDFHQVAQVLLQVTGEMGKNPYYYPPWFAWFFVPIAFFPFEIARAIWMAFNMLIWNISLWRLSDMLHWPQKGWRRYSIFILTTLTFAWITWRYEQAGILVFAILVALIISIRNRKWDQSGLLLTLMLIKPNISFVVVAALSLWLIRKGHWRSVQVMVASFLLLIAASRLMTPGWFRPFFEPDFGQGLTMALDGPGRIVAVRMHTTMLEWMQTIGIEAGFRLFTYIIFTLIGATILFLTIWYSDSLLQVTSTSLLVSYAVTPYALQYDYPPLVVVLFWALSLCKSSRRAELGGFLLAGFVFSVSIWQQNIVWGYWIVIGLMALEIWGIQQAKSDPDAPAYPL